MDIENINQFIKIQGSLIRISKIDFVKKRQVSKAVNFGKVSDGAYPEIIVSAGTEKHIFTFENESEQSKAFDLIEQIITAL